jgi:hypothetical protein
MTNQEAKFVLAAYRPGGQDAGDPALAAAITQARSDLALEAWWTRSQAFDHAMTARLKDVAPPAGLREAILTGAKWSRPKPSQPRRFATAWAMAAALALLLSVGVAAYLHFHAQGPGLASFAQFALNDAHQKGHTGDPDRALASYLANGGVALDRTDVPVTVADLRGTGCRSLDFAGVKVFEVCFQRGGGEYHLYLLPRSEWPHAGPAAQQVELSDRGGAAAAWSDAKFVYALATEGGSTLLRKIL